MRSDMSRVLFLPRCLSNSFAVSFLAQNKLTFLFLFLLYFLPLSLPTFLPDKRIRCEEKKEVGRN